MDRPACKVTHGEGPMHAGPAPLPPVFCRVKAALLGTVRNTG